MRSSLLHLLLAFSLAIYIGSALALTSWDDRTNAARRTRLCKGDKGAGSWVERQGYQRCSTCNSRCYATTFEAEAETSGAPVTLCDTQGDKCDITVIIVTAPCCRCQQGHYENDILEEDLDEKFEATLTESYCEVPFMGVLVNGKWTLPLENDCNLTSNAHFVQEWVADDCTVNQITDCNEAGGSSVQSKGCSAGSRLTQAYKKDYRNGRYPDPCFADSHWVESYTSEEKGLITSRFEMWRPNTNNLWFDKVLSRSEAPVQINCDSIPDVDEIPVFVPPQV